MVVVTFWKGKQLVGVHAFDCCWPMDFGVAEGQEGQHWQKRLWVVEEVGGQRWKLFFVVVGRRRCQRRLLIANLIAVAVVEFEPKRRMALLDAHVDLGLQIVSRRPNLQPTNCRAVGWVADG